MDHYIVESGDGSHTLKLAGFDESYHSSNGAFTEASHIYIRTGIEYLWNRMQSNIVVIDIGLGTALNAISTLLWQLSLRRLNQNYPKIHYIGIEKYPIDILEAKSLNYPELIANKQHLIFPNKSKEKSELGRVVGEYVNDNLFCREEIDNLFEQIHKCKWDTDVETVCDFTLCKLNKDLTVCKLDDFKSKLYPQSPTVVYYDTFSPATQPQLWSKEIFKEIYDACSKYSIITTYCSKGIVKHALREAGFTLERLPGPPGKRHIIRGTKSA